MFVDAEYRTNIPHIYAVGDVIGFPALASTSMDQGRVAVAHIFKTQDLEHLPSHFPYGIYTVPEVSMVGITEEEAIKTQFELLRRQGPLQRYAPRQDHRRQSGVFKIHFFT